MSDSLRASGKGVTGSELSKGAGKGLIKGKTKAEWWVIFQAKSKGKGKDRPVDGDEAPPKDGGTTNPGKGVAAPSSSVKHEPPKSTDALGRSNTATTVPYPVKETDLIC